MCSGAVRNALNLGLDGLPSLDLCFAQVVGELQVQPELRGGLKTRRQPQRHVGAVYEGFVQPPTGGQP